MRVVAAYADAKHAAPHLDRPRQSVALYEGVLHVVLFAKYAVAFSRMSRSILTRASSALTSLVSAPESLPSRLALAQLTSVCSTKPKVLATEALVYPASTRRTASRLNSRV